MADMTHSWQAIWKPELVTEPVKTRRYHHYKNRKYRSKIHAFFLSLSSFQLGHSGNSLVSSFASNHVVQSILSQSFHDAKPNNRQTTIFFVQKDASTRRIPKMPALPKQSSPTASTVVLLDVENVRGANSFRISHESLLSRIRLWRQDRLSKATEVKILEPLIGICDHGIQPSFHYFSSSMNNTNKRDIQMPHNFGVVFAGLEQTADDVIVELVALRCKESLDPSEQSRNMTVVVTADAKLISRCQQARRYSQSFSDLVFVEPASFLNQLEQYRGNFHEEENFFGQRSDSMSKSLLIHGGFIDESRRIDGKSRSMTSFKDSTIAMEQHSKFQARFQNRRECLPTNEIAKVESTEDIMDSKGRSGTEKSEKQLIFNRDSNFYSPAVAKQNTERVRRHLLLSDAYYLARPSKLRGRRSISDVAAIHSKYKERNISKKQQQKLYAKRFGWKRDKKIIDAATKRKDLAQKLQYNLECLSKNNNLKVHDEEKCLHGDGEASTLTSCVTDDRCMLESLLHCFDQERILEYEDRILPGNDFGHDDLQSVPIVFDSPNSLVTMHRQNLDIPETISNDPLQSVLRVPHQESTTSQNVTPLRVVVISDTHGFEGALSKFDSFSNKQCLYSDDYLLPQADILLHCGDFAASGSRKTQRTAARQLDDFFARQTHIPEKVVVKGNHDPDSPAHVLFPNSKALYIRKSSTLVVNGVTFNIEPFSNRMTFRSFRGRSPSPDSLLPPCDVLVSHEPPKGVLDLTYHGFSAGSLYLRELVEYAIIKPRLWLCGHIHEGRGMITTHFHPREEISDTKVTSTMVINASNSNSGKANRLVSGAVVVEVERVPSDRLSEVTLKERKEQYVNDFINSKNGIVDMTEAGMENMQLFITRPGVRRRKGVSQLVRTQRFQKLVP